MYSTRRPARDESNEFGVRGSMSDEAVPRDREECALVCDGLCDAACSCGARHAIQECAE
jgi:hypothetical protein